MNEWFYLFYQDFDLLSFEQQETVYRSFYNLVYKNTYYLTNDHGMTEDIIQESFFKINANVHKYEIINTNAWLKQITRNTALDILKKNHQLINLHGFNIDEGKIHIPEQQVEVIQQVEDKIKYELLHQSIMSLKTDYRIVITLFYINGLSYKELAALLQISEQAVSQRLARARKKLLQQFQGRWGGSNDWS
ncbi:sigma-70 family RNA polymerase sigma factor [Paenibacillus graminis]|uniref:RNA polymerase sigma factor n=1 Tax=Paenibacillus graminis TaxID=189425 RepID=UPI002DB7DDDE|nr:sigma-70 family RNA polymerase sigma factor [Paenibacillus graminis]MEC0168372.1 sigma-70 family RNA polymerase sigma factor [Paenibacillus graminis]